MVTLLVTLLVPCVLLPFLLVILLVRPKVFPLVFTLVTEARPVFLLVDFTSGRHGLSLLHFPFFAVFRKLIE